MLQKMNSVSPYTLAGNMFMTMTKANAIAIHTPLLTVVSLTQ